jgi:two-component system, cell cycle sensor histidine kinase and response regulator CckA
MIKHQPKNILRYGVAIGAVGIALLLSTQIDLLAYRSPFAFLFGAVAISTWYGGLRAGITAIICSLLAADYFVLPPYNSFKIDTGGIVELGAFFLMALLISWLIAGFRQREILLQGSEVNYRYLFENNPMVMWVFDLEDLAFLAVNDAAIAHYGYSREEFLSMTIKDIRPEADIPALVQEAAAKDQALKSVGIWRHRKKDGTIIDVEVVSHALWFKGKEARLVLSTDITERTTAEMERQASEARYQTLFEYAPAGILIADPESYYLDANDDMCRMLGYSRDELIGMHAVDIVPPDEVEYIAPALKVVKSTAEYNRCWRFRRKDGSIFEGEVTATQMPDGNILAVIRDITERNHLEGQLRQAQKMEAVGLLAGGIAHDFNNLLTAITGYSDLTLKKLRPDDPLSGNIREIRDAGDRAASLTSQLLAFSRKQVLKPEILNLNAVIEKMEKMLRRIVRESIEFQVVLDPALGNIKADPGQMEQVIVNLVVNARDAILGGGRLMIKTENIYLDEDYVSQHIEIVPGPFVKITLSDTGQGMDEATRRRIFEPFFTTKEVGKGSGLGLSTVYGIIKQSGGDITVYSELGYGTTFKIYLPRVDENVTAPARDLSGGDGSGTETILLVEDEELVRNLIREILVDAGYRVLDAPNGKEALAICESYPDPIDLMLTDVVMPGMSGVELKKEVMIVRPDIKVLLMSGYTDESLAAEGKLNTEGTFIEKPFAPDSITRKIREVLDS